MKTDTAYAYSESPDAAHFAQCFRPMRAAWDNAQLDDLRIGGLGFFDPMQEAVCRERTF